MTKYLIFPFIIALCMACLPDSPMLQKTIHQQGSSKHSSWSVQEKSDRSTTEDDRLSLPIVPPLIQTTWGQSGLYQTETPTKDGQPTYPGCTTIASAQILFYYQYQNRANNAVSYTLEHSPLRGNGIDVHGSSLYLDLPSYTYDYSQMALDL